MQPLPASAVPDAANDRLMISAAELLSENARLRAALRDSERLAGLGRLMCGLTHELNNPLAVVMGRAELLAEDATHSDAVRSGAGRIVEAAARCGRLLRSCQNLTRQRPLTPAPVQLTALLRSTLELVAYPLRRLGVTLDLDLDECAPPLHADADQLGQLLASLLLDAVQAMQGCRMPKLCIATGALAGAPGGQWLRIADNGPAVPTVHHAGFFDAGANFRRSQSPGHGLGLPLAREIARSHGGELTLEVPSPPRIDGCGVSLLLTLPQPSR